jgi:sorting nexin-13
MLTKCECLLCIEVILLFSLFCVLSFLYFAQKLLQLQRISGSIEVWDFLSVDSQTYAFSSSFSIIETLTVKPVNKTSTVATNIASMTQAAPGPLPRRENLSSENGISGQNMRNNVMVDDVKSKVKNLGNDHVKTPDVDVRNRKENGGLKVGTQHADDVACAGLPTEVYPHLASANRIFLIFYLLHRGKA